MADKSTVLGCVSDLVADFLYYDRKGDEDLPRGTIEEMITQGEITIEDIVAAFDKELRDHVK